MITQLISFFSGRIQSRMATLPTVPFSTFRRAVATLAIVALLFSPLQVAFASTNSFTDSEVGHSNEVLQQEAEFENNPESQLILDPDNSMTHGDIPEPIPTQDGDEAPNRQDDPTYPAEPIEIDEAPSVQPCTPPTDSEATPEESPDLEELNASASATSDSEVVTVDDEVTATEDTPITEEDNTSIPCTYYVGTGDEAAGQVVEVSDDSELDSEAQAEYDVEILNTNNVQVVNDVGTEGLSGKNDVIAEEDIEMTDVESGDVNVFANVLNIVNTNMYNSEIVEIIENFNDLTSDVYMNFLETTPAERTQNLVSGICDDSLECQSMATFRLTNRNEADVENNVMVTGQSGENSLEGFEIEDSSIQTGDVNALINVLNIVNTNLVNSRWTVASFNVFGDWDGDLVMPSELYFRDAMAVGTVVDSEVLVSEIQKVILNIDNHNDVEIENNIIAETGTGENEIIATGTADGDGGDIEEGNIETGSGQSYVNVDNHLNTTLYNGMWFLGMVNTLGDWSGDVYALPEEVAMIDGEFGASFFATSEQNPEILAMFEDAVAEAERETEVQVDVENSNDATITNNVVVGAYTGGNNITATEVERARIKTGNARALANILNFANTNLINADLYIGLTNIFGNWNGDVVFGYPDLAVNQTLLQGEFPKEASTQVNYQIDVDNDAGTSMRNTKLEWQYDPAILDLDSVNSAFSFSQPSPGLLLFDLGNFGPRASTVAQIELRTRSGLADGADVETLAHVYGTGPERNTNNNQSVLHALVGDDVLVVPSISPADGGNGSQQQNPNPSQQPQTPPDINNEDTNPGSSLSVTKTNTANGKTLKVGDELTFEITVKNTGVSSVDGIVVYDRLSTPEGDLIFDENFDIGKLMPGRSATIEYDMGISAEVPGGVYTNSAYAQGFASGLKMVKSTTARSSFKVDGPVVTPGPLGEPIVPAQPPVIPEDVQLGEEDQVAEDGPLVFSGKFEGARNAFSEIGLSNKKSGSGTSSSIKGAFDRKNHNIGLIPEAAAKEDGSFSFGNPLVSSVIISLLIAFGYTTASVREKIKLKKQKPQ